MVMRDVTFDWSIKILIKVALYLWDTKNEKWEKPEVEGTLFVYRFVYYFIFKLLYFLKIFSIIFKTKNSVAQSRQNTDSLL